MNTELRIWLALLVLFIASEVFAASFGIIVLWNVRKHIIVSSFIYLLAVIVIEQLFSLLTLNLRPYYATKPVAMFYVYSLTGRFIRTLGTWIAVLQMVRIHKEKPV